MKLINKLFNNETIRTIWDKDEEKYYISIIDIVSIISNSKDGRKYWNKLKQRLKEEGNETVTNCHQLKLVAEDGKKRLTDVADTEQLFRLIQSVPSPKAEPFKSWMAQIASERIAELQDPELTIDRAMWEYKRLGYSDSWINQRLKSIEIRKNLTDEWKRCGMEEGVQFASLTDIITKTWSDKTTKEYKAYKGLKKENLRDNMTNTELILNMLAEASTTELSQVKNPQNFDENASVAMEGGKVAKVARQQLESQLGRSVVSPLNAHSTLEKLPEDTEKDE